MSLTALVSATIEYSFGQNPNEKLQPAQKTSIDANISTSFLVEDDRIRESSGLAFSRQDPNILWTHNDSGDVARLFAIDQSGRTAAVLNFDDSVKAVDWEDMACFKNEEASWLVIADTGDNLRRRARVTIYFVEEPVLQIENSEHAIATDTNGTAELAVGRIHTFHVTYPGGARDCEAIAVDAENNRLLLFSKAFIPICEVFEVPFPATLSRTTLRESPTDEQAGGGVRPANVGEVTANKITSIAGSMITGADFDTRTGDLWLSSYFLALKYPAEMNLSRSKAVDSRLPSSTSDESKHIDHSKRTTALISQLRQTPESVEMPRWRQIEAIAVNQFGSPWVSSEGTPMKVGELSCLKLNKSTESTLRKR